MADAILKILCMTIIVLSVICDWYTFKIKNSITVSFMIIGILYNIAFFGSSNLYPVILGLIIPFAALFPLYLLNMLGAGDIKLFCAIGAITGLGSVLYTMAYSYLTGALIAIIVMLTRKNALKRFLYFYQYLKNCCLCMQLLPYANVENQELGSKMHFSIPIAFGMMLVLLQRY